MATASADGEFSRAELARDIEHDYSTSDDGVVPLSRRRSRYSFFALWLTFVAGFTTLFLGFQLHDAGYSLPRAALAGAVGAVAYLLYALPAAYLGSRTGQTHALLTRSILGRVGSVLVSLTLIGVAAGWIAFAFTLLAHMFDGLYGWGHIVMISVVFAVVGVANTLLGFTGISAFARFIVTPLMILWVIYLVAKGMADVALGDLSADGAAVTTLPFLAGAATAIGTVMWGNEPDTWRYGQPRFTWPLPPYALALAVGLVLFVSGGWLMAELSGAGAFDFGPAYRATVEYSLFGLLWLGLVVATVLQVAINDGNYYEQVNAGQNLVGHLPGWRRWYTCALVAGVSALVTWQFPRLEEGFFQVTGWTSIALPSVTVVMAVDQFVLPRVLGITRAVEPIPAWREAAIANWPGIVAVATAVLFGAWGLGLFPGQDAAPSAGLVPLEAWALAGLLYLGLAAVAARATGTRALLGIPSTAERRAGALR
jgi:purine-cytosine permease-like protein